MSEVEAELGRFVAAAQRVVAGLPAEEGEAAGEAEEEAAGDGRRRALRVLVTVHRDLGAFMASKPGLEVVERVFADDS